jgi:hypothetical protein
MRWTTVDTNDLPSIQQADAPVDALGYVAVARDTTATPGPGITDDETSSVATIAIAAGLVVLAVAAAVTLWGPSIKRGKPATTSRRRTRSARGSRRPR